MFSEALSAVSCHGVPCCTIVDEVTKRNVTLHLLPVTPINDVSAHEYLPISHSEQVTLQGQL